MLRVIKEVRPTWVIGENVAGIISMALEDVCADLENEGFEVQSFVIPACAKDAQHRRDRVWIVGYSEHNGRASSDFGGSGHTRNDDSKTRQIEAEQSERSGLSPVVADSAGKRSQSDSEPDCRKSGSGERIQPQHARTHGDLLRQSSSNTDSTRSQRQQLSTRIGGDVQNSLSESLQDPQRTGCSGQAQPGVCRGVDGIPKILDPVIENCFDVPAWVAKDETGPNYKNRIKALGNSIVPQVVYQIFKAIKEIEDDTL